MTEEPEPKKGPEDSDDIDPEDLMRRPGLEGFANLIDAIHEAGGAGPPEPKKGVWEEMPEDDPTFSRGPLFAFKNAEQKETEPAGTEDEEAIVLAGPLVPADEWLDSEPDLEGTGLPGRTYRKPKPNENELTPAQQQFAKEWVDEYVQARRERQWARRYLAGVLTGMALYALGIAAVIALVVWLVVRG